MAAEDNKHSKKVSQKFDNGYTLMVSATKEEIEEFPDRAFIISVFKDTNIIFHTVIPFKDLIAGYLAGSEAKGDDGELWDKVIEIVLSDTSYHNKDLPEMLKSKYHITPKQSNEGEVC